MFHLSLFVIILKLSCQCIVSIFFSWIVELDNFFHSLLIAKILNCHLTYKGHRQEQHNPWSYRAVKNNLFPRDFIWPIIPKRSCMYHYY